MTISVDFGPTKAAQLLVLTTANGVMVTSDNRGGAFGASFMDAAVFNDPREFAAWCEAWMVANVTKGK